MLSVSRLKFPHEVAPETFSQMLFGGSLCRSLNVPIPEKGRTTQTIRQLNESLKSLNTETVQPLTLLQLPTEIHILILMYSGFRATITISKASKYWKGLVFDKATWHDYTLYTPDRIETYATVYTKLFRFDRLEFGIWPKNSAKDKTVYLEHMTFLNTDYDFLGGISFNITKNGSFKVEYFENLFVLPCYINAVKREVASGLISSSFETFDAINENALKLNHACKDCSHFLNREIISSQFMHSHKTPIFFSYTFPGLKQTLSIRIANIDHKFGSDKGPFPWVCIFLSKKKVDINVESCDGLKFSKLERSLFEKLVYHFFM